MRFVVFGRRFHDSAGAPSFSVFLQVGSCVGASFSVGAVEAAFMMAVDSKRVVIVNVMRSNAMQCNVR